MIKCIVVDDERMILDTICHTIKQVGAEVVGAYQDALEALDGIKTRKPDAVFLDVEIPGMNGIELAERIVALDSQIQIVFVTAYE